MANYIGYLQDKNKNVLNINKNNIVTNNSAVPTGRIIDGKPKYIKKIKMTNVKSGQTKTAFNESYSEITNFQAIMHSSNFSVPGPTFYNPDSSNNYFTSFINSANEVELIVGAGTSAWLNFNNNYFIIYISFIK